MSRAAAVAVAAAAALHLAWTWPYTRLAHHDFDALHLFFPLAAELASQGLAFLADERSTQAPFFAYFHAALFGRSLETLKAVNAGLSVATLLLAARVAWLAHSPAAGVAAAFLFAVSPLRAFLATPVTEPTYLLLNALWIWGLAEWIVAGRRWALAASAAALALATLTRATMFYWLPLLAAAFAWLAWRRRGAPEAGLARGAAIAYGAALLLPAAFIAKNLYFFQFPFFAAGAGNALYLGNNPVTGGYDPVYVGLGFDVGSIARDQSPLTLEAERLLGGVARYMIADQDPASLLAHHARKLAAFVFVTSAEHDAGTWRAWRIAAATLAAIGALAVRLAWLRGLLVGVLAYQVAVLVPMLYTHRYSVGAMELWLVILGGVGVASLASRERWRRALAAAAFLAGAVGAGEYARRHADPPEPDVFRAARLRMFDAPAARHAFGPGAMPLEVAVRSAREPFHPWFNYAVVIEAALEARAAGTRCGPLRVAYRRAGEAEWSAEVPRRIRAGQGVQRRQVGSVPLRLDADGTLRLAMDCSGPAVLDLRRLTVYSPMGSIDYRERFLGEAPLFPGAFER